MNQEIQNMINKANQELAKKKQELNQNTDNEVKDRQKQIEAKVAKVEDLFQKQLDKVREKLNDELKKPEKHFETISEDIDRFLANTEFDLDLDLQAAGEDSGMSAMHFG